MATRKTLHVEVVTAERELYNGEAEMVNVEGSEGRMGILPEHAPLLALLAPGPLRIALQGAEDTLFVAGGFIEVSNDAVTILADAAEYAEEIDQAAVEEARRRAQERLEQVESREERADVEAQLQRAMNRLKVAELARRSSRRRISAASTPAE
ncbi:MAG TPA: F0F1 ATP synthase subunit epsilon [Ktedonobacteraceae bacterium]|jgi:F-type H+-transporting ATPase subunit epsilon|nr:F0F1 ATP synthase subunit epsilon [Ktedonobacteraceae bacterium]